MLRNGSRNSVGALHTTDILVAGLRVIWLGARISSARIVPPPDLRAAVGKSKTSTIVVVPSECRKIAPHVVRGAVDSGEPNEVKSIIDGQFAFVHKSQRERGSGFVDLCEFHVGRITRIAQHLKLSIPGFTLGVISGAHLTAQ